MVIKYKRNTGSLLRDISLGLNIPVNMKIGEEALKSFFHIILKDLSTEKSIEVISELPAFLKPFCHTSTEIKFDLGNSNFYSELNKKNTFLSIVKVLEKYMPQDKHPVIFNCFHEIILSEMPISKKEVFMAA